MKIRKGSLNYYLLLALEKTIDGLIYLEDFTYHPYKYAQGPNLGPNRKKSSLVHAIRRLRKGGYIERDIDQGKIILKLTQLGRDYLGIEEDWDGKYRIVIWDIPENKRRIRDLFRRRLKEWGFRSWQRSVWVSKKNITKRLRKLILELGIEKWVAVVESDDSSLEDIIFHDRGV